MLVPTTADVIRTVANSLETVISPALDTLHQRSAMLTIQHMLRYLEKSVEMEGQALFDEALYVRTLLGDISEVYGAAGGAYAQVAIKMEAVLADARDTSQYPTTPSLVAEVKSLRGLVDDALKAFHGDATENKAPAIVEAHKKITNYLTWQLAQEAVMIESAFVGQGARR